MSRTFDIWGNDVTGDKEIEMRVKTKMVKQTDYNKLSLLANITNLKSAGVQGLDTLDDILAAVDRFSEKFEIEVEQLAPYSGGCGCGC